jgi:hypothetical protein
MEMGEPKGHVRQASLATLLARVAAAPWTAMPHQVSNHPLRSPSNALHILGLDIHVLGAAVQGADVTQAQGESYAAASRRANSLLEYAWLYVFAKASSPAPLRCASRSMVAAATLALSVLTVLANLLQCAKTCRDACAGAPCSHSCCCHSCAWHPGNTRSRCSRRKLVSSGMWSTVTRRCHRYRAPYMQY